MTKKITLILMIATLVINLISYKKGREKDGKN